MDWKERFKQEYEELCERCEKLALMLSKYANNELDFVPNCPMWILNKQLEAMIEYKQILEARNYIEKIW